MTDQAKDKADIEAEEEAKRLWSVTITMLRNGRDLNSAMIAAIAAKLRERDAALERADAIILRYEIDLTACQRQLAAADAEITNLKLELDCKHTSNLQCHFHADQICKRHAVESMKSQLAAANSKIERLKEAHRQIQLLDAQFAQLSQQKGP